MGKGLQEASKTVLCTLRCLEAFAADLHACDAASRNSKNEGTNLSIHPHEPWAVGLDILQKELNLVRDAVLHPACFGVQLEPLFFAQFFARWKGLRTKAFGMLGGVRK